MFILLIALLLLASPTHGQTSFKVGGVQSTEDLPVINPVKLEDFKAEAEEEIQLKLDV